MQTISKMKKDIALLLACLLVADVAFAEKIGKDEARKIASEFFSGPSERKAAPYEGDATLRLAGEGSAYYAFNRGTNGGYVIVAADDRADAQVLGFADKGTFSADSMPSAMRWWLDEYARQLEYAPAKTTAGSARTEAVRADIAPMVTAKWDQLAPYNAFCPEYYGEKSVTGCEATAMAQIMYYHKWPKRGTGSHSYEWIVDEEVMGTLSADFSQSVYDWESMTDTYGENSTKESEDAVARLMYDVGVSIDMVYSSSESGADANDAAPAYVSYFGYDKSLCTLERDYYSTAEWEDIVYGSLEAGRPVLYMGVTPNSGGHAFVCDGYADGYYHINWGWSGMCDGYFLLQALNPEIQGTGGFEGGYNTYQYIVPDIRPDEGGTAEPLIYCEDGFDTDQKEATHETAVMFTGGFGYAAAVSCDVNLGLKVTDTEGNATYVEGLNTASLGTDKRVDNYYVDLAGFPTAAGNYVVTPACQDKATGKWYDIRTAINSNNYCLNASVGQDGSITFSNPEPKEYDLELANFTLKGKPYASTMMTVSGTVANNGLEYYGNIALAIGEEGAFDRDEDDESEDDVSIVSEFVRVSLVEGASVDFEFTVSMPDTPGNYELAVVTEDGQILGRTPLTVTEAPDEELALTLSEAPKIVGDGPLSADNINIEASVECSAGYYAGMVYAAVFPHVEQGSVSNVAMFDTELYISSGETQTVNIHGSLPSAQVGDKYFIILYYIHNGSIEKIPADNNRLEFTIGTLTPVGGVEATARPHDIEVYTTAGVCVLRQKAAKADLSELAPGLYIVKENGTTRKVVKK